jgi:hypothetical protein
MYENGIRDLGGSIDEPVVMEQLQDALAAFRRWVGMGKIVNEEIQRTCVALHQALGMPEASEGLAEAADDILATFPNAGPDEMPEILWLRMWCSLFAPATNNRLVDMPISAGGQVFGPVRLLLYRGLVRRGRRRELTELLPETDELSLFEFDALLETGCIERLGNVRLAAEATEDELLPAPVRQFWSNLVTTEAELAKNRLSQSLLEKLERWHVNTELLPPETPGIFPPGYLQARCTAALARARIAARLDAEDILTGKWADGMPNWECKFLLGMSSLSIEQPKQATAHLEMAYQTAPRQGTVAIALAGRFAEDDPQRAVTLFDEVEASFETLIAKAALLLRCRRDDEARECLTAADEPNLPGEPARLFQDSVRVQYRLQRKALATALFERQGRWSHAAAEWVSGDGNGQSSSLIKARELYQAVQEQKNLAGRQIWRQSLLAQKIARSRYELSQAVLNHEALFYWAAGNCDSDPAEAVRGFRRLVRQLAWTEAQQRVGGDRLVLVGDVLLRNGETADALRAYRMAQSAGYHEVEERLAVAKALCGDVTKIVDNEVQEPPVKSWYPPFFAAVRLTIVGMAEKSAFFLIEARARKAPESLCRLLEAIVNNALPASILTEEELTGLDLPVTVEPIIRLLAGPGSWTERLCSYARVSGTPWRNDWPVAPAVVAAALTLHLCREEKWSEALATADRLLATNDPTLQDVALLAHVLWDLETARQQGVE